MLLKMSDQTYIIIFLVVVAITSFITVMLFFRVRHARRRFKEERAIILEGLLTKNALVAAINTYLAKVTPDMAFGLIYIEINNYADIINAFGKRDAARALEKTAYYLAHNVPKRVQIANFRSTEFLVFLKSEYDRFQCIELGKKLLSFIEKPVKIYHDTTVRFTGNIGISFYPAHGRKYSQLEQSLQLALQAAKKLGSNRLVVYGSEMSEESKGGDLEYHYDIKKAMENKEFILYYQPIIDIHNNKIFGVEALVRWKHPKHGILSPVQFINTMEQTGDINWIGTWGVETVTREYLSLKRRFPDNEFVFNLNLSDKQMMESSLPQEFLKIVRRYNLTPTFICLEISNFSLIEKEAVIKQNLYNYKKAGFKIAFNGFGLDHNSLAVLEKIPLDIIKLDHNFFESDSFINKKIADLIIEFSKKQKISIVAEGIETGELFNTIRNLDINYVQGFYFSPPILSENLLVYIEEEKWKQKDYMKL